MVKIYLNLELYSIFNMKEDIVIYEELHKWIIETRNDNFMGVSLGKYRNLYPKSFSKINQYSTKVIFEFSHIDEEKESWKDWF